jgi:hypothetical protein
MVVVSVPVTEDRLFLECPYIWKESFDRSFKSTAYCLSLLDKKTSLGRRNCFAE